MARPSKTAEIDYRASHKLSHGLLDRAKCPEGARFVPIKDADTKGLCLRVTAAGGKRWQYEARVNGKLFTRALGEWPAVSIEQAQREARALRAVTATKTDPRELERQQEAEEAAKAAQAEAVRQANAARVVRESRTVGEAWAVYVVEGSPKRRDAWKPRYLADMHKMAALGGEPKKRGKGLTLPGPLAPLLALRLTDIDEDRLALWFNAECKRSKHQAARALMMFRGFLRWCATRPEYRALVDRDAGKAPAIMDNLPANKRRTDALEAAQVRGWWAGVEQLSNRAASAYLRALLLTGARREEMAALKWADVDFQWRKLTIADKVGDTRTFPLSPYMAQMLSSLPRMQTPDGHLNPFVFASESKSGRIADVRASHTKALQSAGIDSLTIHGLRRSFALLGESAGAPAGAVAQVMGHRPSATAEGYKPRSVDALRPFLERIEAHILELAGVRQSPTYAA